MVPTTLPTQQGPCLPLSTCTLTVRLPHHTTHPSSTLSLCTGVESCVFRQQFPVLLATGFLVALGVVTLGRKVVQTVSIDMAQINYMRCECLMETVHMCTHNTLHRGWTAAFAATMVVMGATALRVPLSTIHCQVGAVAAVGVTAFGLRSGSWDLFFRTLLTWLITFPACALLGAGICWVLNFTI